MPDIDININAHDNGAESTLDRLARKAKELRREDALSGEKALGGFLNRGPDGIIDYQLGKLGQGMNAMLVGFAGSMFASFASKVRELSVQYSAGKISGAQILHGLASEIPLVGTFYKGFRDIREMLTGDEAKSERDEQSDKLDEQMATSRRDFFERASNERRAMLRSIADTHGETGVLSVVGSYRQRLAASQEQEAKIGRDAADKKVNDKLDDAKQRVVDLKPYNDNVDRLQAEYDHVVSAQNLPDNITSAKQRDIASQLDKAKTERDDFERQRQSAIDRRDDLAQAKLIEDLKKNERERANLVHDFSLNEIERERVQGQRVLDIDAQTEASRLASRKNFFAADELLAKRAYEEKISDLKAQAETDIKNGSDRTARMAQLATETDALAKLFASQGAGRSLTNERSLAQRSFGLSLGASGANADVLRRLGRGNEAARIGIQSSAAAQIMALAQQLDDSTLSAGDRQNIMNSIAGITAVRNFDLNRLGNPGVQFSNAPAGATPYSQRFSRGYSDFLLDRTVSPDVSAERKAQADLAADTKRIKDILEMILKNATGSGVVVSIMNAVGK